MSSLRFNQNPLSTSDVNRIEASVTFKAHLICAFATFGGIFFGDDTGWMSGVLNMPYFIKQYTHKEYPDVLYPGGSGAQYDAYIATFVVASWEQSLTTSILSAGTFFGAIVAGDCADFIDRRLTLITGCLVFIIGRILETVSTRVGCFADLLTI